MKSCHSGLTLEKLSRIENLHHGIPIQFAGHGAVLAHILLPAPEDATLAEPLDEDPFLIGTHQDASLNVAQQLVSDEALLAVLDELSWGEMNSLHAV